MTIINYPRVVDCYVTSPLSPWTSFRVSKVKEIPKHVLDYWQVGRLNAALLGRVSLSLNSYQNPQFGMTINKIPLLEIKDFGPPARGGHFVLFHSLLPPQPFGTQFHTAHSSPVQLVYLTLPHVGGREQIKTPITTYRHIRLSTTYSI